MDYYESRRMENLQNALTRISTITRPEYQVYAIVLNGAVMLQIKNGATIEWMRAYRAGSSYSIPKYLLKE